MNQQNDDVAKKATRTFFTGIIDADQRQYDGLVKEIERKREETKITSGIIVCE